jgi:hypothetical protein
MKADYRASGILFAATCTLRIFEGDGWVDARRLQRGSEHGGGQLGYVLAIQIAKVGIKGENVHKVSSATLLYVIEFALKQAVKAGENLGQSETSLT